MDSVVLCVTYGFVRELRASHGEATKSDYLDLKSEILMLSSIGLLCKHVLKESRMDNVYPCKGNFKI